MLRAAITLFLILSSNVHAAYEFTIEDPCSDQPILRADLNQYGTTLGDVTIEALKKSNIPFKGSREGVASMLNTPTGDESVDILSNYEMRAFGWCYELNGKMLESMPDGVITDEKTRSVRWFYAYAHYLKGDWISQCEEDKKIIKKFFCKK